MNNYLLGSSFGWCKRSGICAHCENELSIGEQQVKTKMQNPNGKYNSRREHIECFVERMYKWFNDHPFAPKKSGHKGGRKALDISPEGHRQRATLLQKKKRWEAKLDKFMELGLKYRIDEIIKILRDIDKKTQEIV